MDILVGLSGGMDSCVSAYLLKQQGHHVEGVTMLIWKEGSSYPVPPRSNSCFEPEREEDINKIRAFCEKIGIGYRTLDCSDLYEKIVLDNFRSEYMNGRTPNPCIWCNSRIKFGALVEHAAKSGLSFDKFATGHYARIRYDEGSGRWQLLKGKDLKKDQSYFLYRLSQEQLSRTLFPLGEAEKKDIRVLDEELGFHERGQKESQDFYSGDYADLLNVEERKGKIVTTSGLVLGEHDGFWHYTIGQRRGLGVSASAPLYVVALDSVKNEVIVGFDEETHQSGIEVEAVNFVSSTSFLKDHLYSVKIRSASQGVPAFIEETQDGFRAIFPEGVKAATAGQSAVVYDGDLLIAGGIIERALARV